MLTNGRCFDFYKILFSKPIESRKVFSIDFSNPQQLKDSVEVVQFMHKDAVSNKGLDLLWNKCIALDPANVAGFLYTPTVINFIKKSLKIKYKHKFSEEEIKISIDKIVFEAIGLQNIKHIKIKKLKLKTEFLSDVVSIATVNILETRLATHEATIESSTDEIH